MRISIFDQSNSLALSADLVRQWTYNGGPVGYQLDEDGAVQIINGVVDGDGVGTVFASKIVVECDYPITLPCARDGWHVDGGRLTIGGGGECLPPQSCLTIRTRGIPHRPGPFEMHGVTLPHAYTDRTPDIETKFRAALASGGAEQYSGGILPTLFETGFGLWRPEGRALPDSAYGGGYSIEPISGYERSAILAIMRNDAVMERHRIFAVNAVDGLPVAHPTLPEGGYSLARGWAKSTVLPRFCKPLNSDPYDARRVPVSWNAGTCSYLARLCGIGDAYYSGTSPHDHEHTIRALRHAKAASMIWHDAPATRFLAMIAQEILWAWPNAPHVTIGQGSSMMGRAYAWSLDALLAAGRPEAKAFVEAAVAAQMSNGQTMRMSHGYYFPVPSPWAVSPDVPNPFPITTDVASAKECFYMAHSLSIGRHPRNAKLMLQKALDVGVAQGGVVPRDFGVGTTGGAAFPDLDGRSHPQNYDHWLGIGKGAWDYGQSWIQHYGLLLGTPTQGRASSIADLKVKLQNEQTGRSQCVAALAALEAT